ncbi:MAG: hypothetical protein Q4C96_02125 [Planctomycetia bacterium]|nr:hypothetical protein [Planctomycetia bacterium]
MKNINSISGIFCRACLFTIIFSFMSGNAFSTPPKTWEMAKKAKMTKGTDKAPEGYVEVDLFQAIADGKVQAGIIQEGMAKGKLFMENVSDKPLSVKVPQTFGTRPILAQFNQNSNDIEQLFGSNGQMDGGGGGFFNIPPEKVVAMKYNSLCLEYGKPVPSSRSDYELVSIDDVTDKEDVKQLCTLIGTTDLSALQLAAWHLSSGVPVEKLAAEKVRRANGRYTNYFSQKQVQIGIAAIKKARGMAQQIAALKASQDTSTGNSVN